VPLRFRIRPPAATEGLSAIERTIDVEPVAGAVTIGRRAGCDIQLPFATISGQHARVAGGPGHFTVEDLGSANGTVLTGRAGEERRLVPGTPHPLAEGAVLRLAEVTITFEGTPAEPGTPDGMPESTGTLARRLVSDFFGACRPAEVARVVVAEGRDAGREVALGVVGRRYRVGRAAACDLVLTDDDVSREHVSFERRWEGVMVEDLGSKNGVAFQGKRLEGSRRLHDGEAVVIGRTHLRLEDPEDRYLRQMQDEEEGRRTAAGDAAAEVARPPAAPVPVVWPPAQPVRAGRGPLLVAWVAVLVLAGVAALVAWFLLAEWK
jgi:pSer/pThr/pTyr-binding forkhead associated (FHA) protein